jgi:hypothetical protein
VKLAAEYNRRLNAERKNQRTAYFDMQVGRGGQTVAVL